MKREGTTNKHYNTAVANLRKARLAQAEKQIKLLTDDVPTRENIYYRKWQNLKIEFDRVCAEKDVERELNNILFTTLRNVIPRHLRRSLKRWERKYGRWED